MGIKVIVYGGLGNQIFQYACAKKVAKDRDIDLTLDFSMFKSYDLRNPDLLELNTNANYVLASKKVSLLGNRYLRILFYLIFKFLPRLSFVHFESKDYHLEILPKNLENKHLFGYWQHLGYFEGIRKELLNELRLKRKLNLIEENLRKDIQQTISVGLHVRRGDYVTAEGVKNGRLVCDDLYFKRALNILEEKTSHGKIFIFTDDIKWVKSRPWFDEYMTVVSEYTSSAVIDFELLRSCSHFIISNSSFSWWASWLSEFPDKIVVSPNSWFKNKPIPEGLVFCNMILI